MGFREWIIPQEKKFFHLLAKEAHTVVKASEEANSFFCGTDGFEKSAVRMKQIEHDCDGIVHDIFGHLNKTFITPMDQEDISSLALLMDDVVDATYDAVTRATLYGLKKRPDEMKLMSGKLLEASNEIEMAVVSLDGFKFGEVDRCIRHITKAEDESKGVLNAGLVRMFKEKDPIEIMKTKEVYDLLTLAIDKCEDVSCILGDIAVKHR
ncbi:MAG: DUF47 family protein [Candidatus Micrarchaeia archaeon]|jgi:hypothetical protein